MASRPMAPNGRADIASNGENASASFDADKTLDLDGLRQQWRNLSGRVAAPGLTRSLLLRAIAYQRQVDRFGGLAPATERMLARVLEKTSGGKGGGTAVAQVAKATGSDRTFSPGTILVREWQGVPQRVTVMTDGFAWNGTTYPSLSRVAREITGGSWNGHVFFGGLSKRAGGKRPIEPRRRTSRADASASNPAPVIR